MSWEIKPKKFVTGSKITDIHTAIDHLLAGKYLIVRGKPMHPRVLMNWSVATLRGAATYGTIYEAQPNPSYRPHPPTEPDIKNYEFEEIT